MRLVRFLRLGVPALLLAGAFACSKSNDITGTGGALARLSVDAPNSAVSGQAFNVDVKALNIGVTNVHNGMVQITLPAPLTVDSLVASLGTTAIFRNGSSGAAVTWTLNTLDSNTQSTLRIGTTGALAPGEAARTVTVQAMMTADGIKSGDAVARKDVQLMPQ
jgi:hypothetical protein